MVHIVQLDCDLRKHARARARAHACHATRRDATDLAPTRVGQRRSLFVYSLCRLSCQSRNGVTNARRHDTPRIRLYPVVDVTCRTVRNVTIIAHSVLRLPTSRVPPSFSLLAWPCVRRTDDHDHGHVRGRQFFATISGRPRKRTRGQSTRVALDLVQGDRPIAKPRRDY